MPKIADRGAEAPTDYSASFNPVIFDAVPAGARCLDVGCSTGNLGAALRERKGCSVDGVETNPQAAAVAKGRGYGDVFVGDLDRDESIFPVDGPGYDAVVCADVLEHLVSPDRALRRLKKLLRPGGLLIVSLPNVAFFLTRLHLLCGNWDYRDYGIMDRTHLRFYTLKTGRRLLESAGLDVQAVKPYNQFGLLRFIKPLDRWFPGLLAYQFLVIAK